MARGEAEKLIGVLRRMSEEGITNFFSEVLASDNLRRALAGAGERFTHNKGRFDHNVETLLDFINIPSKRDVRELKNRIDHLNGQVVNLNLKLDRLSGVQRGGQAAPRRKRAGTTKARSKRS